MDSNVYIVSFRRMARWLTPKRLRKTKWLAFLEALATPFTFAHQELLRYRAAKVYHLKITPQVCYLEHLLNNRWDRRDRRIYIEDGIDRPPLYIFKTVELKPKYIRRRSEDAPRYIYTRGESTYLLDDFIIWVPDGLDFQEPEMISLVKAYKLAGTKFKIQRY